MNKQKKFGKITLTSKFMQIICEKILPGVLSPRIVVVSPRKPKKDAHQ